MNPGPKTHAAFTQGGQSSVEHDASRSALFYLFEEVSKLASPIHDGFLDARSPSAWLSETSRQSPFLVKEEEEDAYSFQVSTSSYQRALSRVFPYDQVKKAKEESRSSVVTPVVEPHHPKPTSPWKVLSLINLQCEKLLHHSDAEEPQPSSKSNHLKDKASTAAADVTDQGDVPACISPVGDVRVCYVKCHVQSQSQKNIRPESMEETASSEPQIGVNRQFGCEKKCVSSEHDVMHEKTNLSKASRTFNSNESACVTLSKPALTLDHNGNLTLTAEPPCDTQLHPPSSIPPPSATNQDDSIPASNSKRTRDPTEEDSTPDARLKSSRCGGESNASKLEPRLVEKEEVAPPSSQQWRTKTPRKQPHPSRSADIQDPDFQGVLFRMDTELDDSREQCRLLITSKYSKELCKSVRKPRLRTRTSQKSLKTSSSDEESDPTTSVSKGKVCASCCTRKTPMWRDAEDGTPLCNACGIRYKKYRVRCVNCWHIPRKEGNSNSCCLKCGNFVRLTSAQRKHST
ncbi:GATA-type zinc finger protein 1 GATA-like protein 1 [Larimichthys crocea]|uniref:GATA-type zinc finger protein 1 GATA-like protein 1 n=1 Tax=Larimichthys crocea TaxID=215358 RepID=A0A6G0J9A3_LARCR|nr:GATA-type zinc finger protein 1 GATA-like protein 1 [Larimichthys crocea]